ncbi:MAG: Ig-like domain-containing protein, partial [Anaerolineae bacterium]|nr:Ig-like domain-containing protein [Anaerolineae bacterium]
MSFCEKINPDSLDWQAVPDPGGWIFTWDQDQLAVTATHADFQEGTTYAITLEARDLAGNQMAPPFSWSFSTM